MILSRRRSKVSSFTSPVEFEFRHLKTHSLSRSKSYCDAKLIFGERERERERESLGFLSSQIGSDLRSYRTFFSFYHSLLSGNLSGTPPRDSDLSGPGPLGTRTSRTTRTSRDSDLSGPGPLGTRCTSLGHLLLPLLLTTERLLDERRERARDGAVVCLFRPAAGLSSEPEPAGSCLVPGMERSGGRAGIQQPQQAAGGGAGGGGGAGWVLVEALLQGGAPWGFTLQGGLEHGEPLIISKVRHDTISTDQYRSGSIRVDQYGSVSISTDQCRSVRISVDQYGSVSISTDQYRSGSISTDQCRSVRISVDQYRSVSISTDQCRSVRIRVDQYRSVSISTDQGRSVRIRVDQYGSVPITVRLIGRCSLTVYMRSNVKVSCASVQVEDGGKADALEQPLLVGDEIIVINDMEVTGYRQEAIALVKGSYKTLQLTVRRGETDHPSDGGLSDCSCGRVVYDKVRRARTDRSTIIADYFHPEYLDILPWSSIQDSSESLVLHLPRSLLLLLLFCLLHHLNNNNNNNYEQQRRRLTTADHVQQEASNYASRTDARRPGRAGTTTMFTAHAFNRTATT
ncbi:hypothetical protein F2P81_015840 [Scophthalmus maximus]|uniref:PDZ domain-containing protein n=1 Tax=Scophthalmus maximus TaxID=52904 RepID=A0A6A4SFE0_SCOMX|nr:hypothetical protein F2P81_015840 [Scophthalmus maximus]